MKNICCLFLLFLFLPSLYPCSAQGLRFYGNENRIAERSSLCVFQGDQALPAAKHLSISFEYNAQNIESPGYIFYLKDAESELAYNLTYVYTPQDKTGNFMFSQDGQQIIHTVSLPATELHRHWQRIALRLDFAADRATICIGTDSATVNNIGMNRSKDGRFTPQLYFGMYRHILETASFCLRKLHVECDGKRWDFPLDESMGPDVHDSHGNVTGRVKNPVWLINDSYHWKLLYRYYSLSPAGFAFSTSRQQAYIYNRDSLIVYDPYQRTAQGLPYDSPALPIRLGMCFYDEPDSCIYAYELNGAESYMARINPDSRQWQRIDKGNINQQMHHHGGILDQERKRMLLFGGYGNRSYYNTFIGYDLKMNCWDTITFEGPSIPPRFFAAMAMASDGQHAYLYGGKGNEAGDQNVGIRYYYDLYRLDFKSSRIEKLWEQEAPAENHVPARDMIPSPDGKWLYLLIYPEYKPHTYLRLHRLSIADGRMEALGDSIPMISEEIATNANLYYNARLHEFYCVIQEFGKYGDNETRIYALSAPPVTEEAVGRYVHQPADTASSGWWIAISVVIALITIGGIWRKRHPRLKEVPAITPKAATTAPSLQQEPSREETNLSLQNRQEKTNSKEVEKADSLVYTPPVLPTRNVLCLFGPFCAIDRQGRDISHLFSPKIRHLFLYILINSVLKDGVLSIDLNVLFWPDKPEDKIKNLKNVNINHLRKALQDMDGIELTHRQGYYRLEMSEACYCDFLRLATLTNKLTSMPDTPSEANNEIIRLLSRGRFLDTTRAEIFDYVKQQVESFAISYLEQQAQHQVGNRALALCKILQMWDPLSEVALNVAIATYRRRNQYDKALQSYATFATAYNQTMGEDYPIRFEETGLPVT